MDPKKKQLLVSTSESLERVSRFLGINPSSYVGRLYNLALIVIICRYEGQLSWKVKCGSEHHCEQRFAVRFNIHLIWVLRFLKSMIILSTTRFRPKQFVFPRQETFIMDSILETYGARFTSKDIFLTHLQDIATAIIALFDVIKTMYDIAKTKMYKFYVFYCYSRMCMLIMNGLFSHYINEIYLRSRELNKITVQHSRENLSVSYIDFTASSNSLFNKCNYAVITKFRSIQHIHHGLYILATKINTNFSLYLVISSAICLVSLIDSIYHLHHDIIVGRNDIGSIISSVYEAFFHGLHFLYISYICQRSRNAFRQMAIILHDAFLEYKSLRAEVVHFSLQLVHENLTFTALGLYEINIPLLCSVAGAMVTYAVLIIQLDTKFDVARYNATTTTTTTTITTITTT